MYKQYFITICFLIYGAPITSFSWEFIGPRDSIEISNLYAFGNGNILAFEGNSHDEKFILFSSRNYGSTWDTIIDNKLPPFGVCRFSILYYNNFLWAGINNYELYKSADSGNTWIKDSGVSCGGNMAYSFVAKDSVLLVGTFNNFSRTIDYGKTWQNYIKIPGLAYDFNAVFCMMNFRDVVYAGTQYGIFSSKDWGLTWEKRGFNYNGADGATITSLCRIDTVFLMSSYAALFRSYELGLNENSWIYTFDTERAMFLRVADNSNIYVYDYYAGKSAFYFSSDTGKTYEPFSVTNPETYCHNIKSDDKYVYVMGLKGIFRNLKSEDPTGIKKEKSGNKPINRCLFSLKNKILQFSIRQPTPIAINLYKLNGQKLFSYINKFYSQDHLLIDLKQIKINSGLYIVNTKTAFEIQTNIIAVE